MRARHVSACVAAILVTSVTAQEPPAPPPAAPAAADPLARALNQAGARELARYCALPENEGEKACRARKAKCDELKKSGVVPGACAPLPVAAPVDPGAPRKLPNPRALPAALDVDVTACRQDAGCVMLGDFHARYAAGFRLLSAWCLTRRLENDLGGFDARGRRAAGRVCDAIAATTDANTGALARVPASYLFVLQDAATKEVLQCSGFGLTLPFVRVRYPTKDDAEVSGPVAAGIGGGYYWAQSCHEDWSWGFDAFAYSEGIDLSNDRFQFGVAAGVGVVVYEQFRLGLDIGYDLYRQVQDANGAVVRNGLFGFENYGRPSVSYMFTLTFQTKSPQKEPGGESD